MSLFLKNTSGLNVWLCVDAGKSVLFFLPSDHKGRQSQGSYKADQNRMLGCHDASQSSRTAVSDAVTLTVTAKQLEKIHLVLMQLNVAAMQKHEDYSISFTKTVSIVISIKIWRTLVEASFLLQPVGFPP